MTLIAGDTELNTVQGNEFWTRLIIVF